MHRSRTALKRLQDGNRDFVEDIREDRAVNTKTRRIELAEGQHPFAIILGCADSRVPAELVFGQGLGDLFVIRVAGNIVDTSQIGSVEYAAEHFGTRLVVVLGHTKCGAVLTTVQALRKPNTTTSSPLLKAIVDHISPSVGPLLKASVDDEEVAAKAIRANIRASVQQLKTASNMLARLIREDALLIVGAEYSLETGAVDFFDGLPE